MALVTKPLTIRRNEPDFLEIQIWKETGSDWIILVIVLVFTIIYMGYKSILFILDINFIGLMTSIPIFLFCIVGLFWINDYTSYPIIISLDAKQNSISKPSLSYRKRRVIYELSLLQALRLSYNEKGGHLNEQMKINPQRELAINYFKFDFGRNDKVILIQTVNHATVKEWYTLFVELQKFLIHNNYKVYIPHI